MMGENKVKSSRSALADRINSTELPKLNVLNRKADIHAGASSKVQPKDRDFSLADEEPTEVGSTDDLLAAVGGIDGWDSIGSSSGMSESDFINTLDNFSSELFNDIDKMDTDKTQALPAPDFNNLPNIKSSGELPMPKSASAATPKTNRKAILDNDIDVPSLRSSKPKLSTPSIKKPSVTLKPAVTAPAPKGISPIPSVPAAPAVKASVPEIKAEDPQPAAPIPTPSVPEIKAEEPQPAAPVSTPSVPEIETAEPQPEAPAADLQPPAPTPSVPEIKAEGPIDEIAPKAASVPAATIQQPEHELSDEEQFAALLESMTPEERAAYEAHSRAQELENIKRQQRLIETYGNSAITDSKKAPVGLFIAIIVVLGIFGFGLYFMLTSESEEETPEETTAQAADETKDIVPVRADPLETYQVTIEAIDVDKLYINGVLKSGGGTHDFVKGHRNSIFAYTKDKVPYFKTFEANETVTETIKIELEPDTIYAKGRLSFRLTDPAIAGAGLKAQLNGVPLSNFPDAQPSVVLGRPHILTLEKEGFGKHMHLIWPDDAANTVTIPELVGEDVAKAGTDCNIKSFPKSAKPYGLLIAYDNQKVTSPIIATVPVGGMIEYHITRDQRKPLQVAIIPEGYGTLSLDTSLMHDSIGTAVVSFKNVSNREDLRVCMRRVGEVICPNMNEETEVPSGTSWEMFAVGGTEENPQLFKGGQAQQLQSHRKYTFDADLTARGIFEMKQTSYNRIKKTEN